jgi:hypothetical protein
VGSTGPLSDCRSFFLQIARKRLKDCFAPTKMGRLHVERKPKKTDFLCALPSAPI